MKNFVETKTIDWEDRTTIHVEKGFYIKNIRMVNQSGCLTSIDIYDDKNLILEKLFVLAFPVYKYIYSIKNDSILPFYDNINGIKHSISIVSNSLNDKTRVGGKLRYDIFELKELDVTSLKSHINGEKVNGNVKYIIKHSYKPENYTSRDKKFITLENIQIPCTKIFRPDSNNIFHLYSVDDTIKYNGLIPQDNIFILFTTSI